MRFWLVFAVAMSLLLMPTATLAKNVVAVGYGTTEAEAETLLLSGGVQASPDSPRSGHWVSGKERMRIAGYL